MTKFTDIQTIVYNIIASADYVAESLPTTITENFTGDIPEGEFIRVNLTFGGINNTAFGDSSTTSGIVRFDIFTAAGTLPTRSYEVADILDNYFQNKNIDGVSFGKSTLTPQGIDTDNSSYFRSNYSVQFNKFN